jgi:rhodanese-related sulfurtransferase
MTARTVAELVQDAKRDIESLTVEQVEAEAADGRAVLIDIRDAGELANGTIPGAVHASRGMLEFHADPNSAYHKDELDPARRTILYCASGGRSALAVKALKQMGYQDVAHLDGGFKAWEAAGKPTKQ